MRIWNKPTQCVGRKCYSSGSYGYQWALRDRSDRISIIFSYPVPKHQTINHAHVMKEMSRSQMSVHLWFNISSDTQSALSNSRFIRRSLREDILSTCALVQRIKVHAYSEITFTVTHYLTYFMRMFRQVQAPDTQANRNRYLYVRRPHSRLFHTASGNFGTD